MSITSSVEKLGILRTFDSRPIKPIAVPSDAKAEKIGKAMAQIEPKTKSSTTPAKITPGSVPPTEGLFACSATCPDTAILRSPLWSRVADATNACERTVSIWNASWLNLTCAKAILPSLLICWAPKGEKGDTTDATWGTPASLVNVDSIAAFVDGSVTDCPAGTSKTTRSRSPLFCGEAACSTLRARVDSVLGRLNDCV